MTTRFKRRVVVLAGSAAVAAAVSGLYIKTHPLVFNESFFDHAHCIVQTGLALRFYAAEHDGKFPFDTNGYGNALLLLTNYVANFWGCLTGPGYDGKVFAVAAQTGQHIPEHECGRVYVQGLSETNEPEIALFFDKRASPGSDHCHGIHRLFAPLGREVWTVGCSHLFIRESQWAEFAARQIEMLVAAGISRQRAEELYSLNHDGVTTEH